MDRRKKTGSMILFIIIFIPILSIVLNSAFRIINDGYLYDLLSSRRILLLLKTFSLSLLVALSCSFMSYFIALRLYFHEKFKLEYLIVFLFSLFLLPSNIYVMTWYKLLNRMILSGYYKALIVLILYYLPIGILLLLLGMFSLDKNYIDSARVYNTNQSLVLKLIPGLIKPFILALMSLIMLLTLSDFSVPSLFQYPTYSMEVFSEFSVANDTESAFVTALPLIASSLIILLILLKNVEAFNLQNKDNIRFKVHELAIPKSILFTSGIFMFFFLIHLIVVLVNLTSYLTPHILVEVFMDNRALLIYSFFVSIFSALLAVVIVYFLDKSIKKLLLLPLLIPGPIIGISLINLFRNSTQYSFLINSNTLLIYANVLRVIPLIVLVSYGIFHTINYEMIEAAKLYNSKRIIRITRVYIPLMLPSMIVSFLVGFSFSFNEIASSILLIPPGKELISLRMYSYLHYGSSERIVMLGLIVVILFAIVCLLLFAFMFKKRRYFK